MLDSAFTPLVVPRVGELPLDLRGEADRARTRGYADGFAEGRRVALDEAHQQQAAEAERMRQLREAYLQQRGAALNAVRTAQAALDEQLVHVGELSSARIEELAVELAMVILGAELSDPARSAAHAFRRALDQAPVARWTRVAFSERDAAVLEEDPDAASLLHDGIEVIASPAVDDGGAVVEVDGGAVDIRVAAALRRASAALRGDDDEGAEVLP